MACMDWEKVRRENALRDATPRVDPDGTTSWAPPSDQQTVGPPRPSAFTARPLPPKNKGKRNPPRPERVKRVGVFRVLGDRLIPIRHAQSRSSPGESIGGHAMTTFDGCGCELRVDRVLRHMRRCPSGQVGKRRMVLPWR